MANSDIFKPTQSRAALAYTIERLREAFPKTEFEVRRPVIDDEGNVDDALCLEWLDGPEPKAVMAAIPLSAPLVDFVSRERSPALSR